LLTDRKGLQIVLIAERKLEMTVSLCLKQKIFDGDNIIIPFTSPHDELLLIKNYKDFENSMMIWESNMQNSFWCF